MRGRCKSHRPSEISSDGLITLNFDKLCYILGPLLGFDKQKGRRCPA